MTEKTVIFLDEYAQFKCCYFGFWERKLEYKAACCSDRLIHILINLQINYHSNHQEKLLLVSGQKTRQNIHSLCARAGFSPVITRLKPNQRWTAFVFKTETIC